MQVVSAFLMKNGDVPSAPQRSWPIKARPSDFLSIVATTTMNWCRVCQSQFAEAVPGWLKRTTVPLFLYPTHKYPEEQRTVGGEPGLPGIAQP